MAFKNISVSDFPWERLWLDGVKTIAIWMLVVLLQDICSVVSPERTAGSWVFLVNTSSGANDNMCQRVWGSMWHASSRVKLAGSEWRIRRKTWKITKLLTVLWPLYYDSKTFSSRLSYVGVKYSAISPLCSTSFKHLSSWNEFFT